MQGSAEGLSLDDIAKMFGVGRRTAERLRDAVDRIFGGLDLRPSDDRRLRWGLPATRLGLLVFTGEELALRSAAFTANAAGRGSSAVASTTVMPPTLP